MWITNLLRFENGRLRVAAALVTATFLAGCANGGTLPNGSGSADVPAFDSATRVASPQSVAPAFGVTDAIGGALSRAPLTLTWPKGSPATGDLLIACAESQWQATPQTPAGWTSLYASGTGFGTALFYKIAGPSEPAKVVFAIPSAFNISASMARVAGAAAGAPVWSHNADHNALTIATTPIVPAATGMLPIACFGGVNATTFGLAGDWHQDARVTGQYVTTIGHRTAPSADTKTAISTTATASSTATINDAYGLLVAPATSTAPGAIALTPAAIAFTSLTAPAQAVTATQTGTTTFTASSQDCNGIATISRAAPNQFSLAPAGAGVCTVTIAGSGGHTVTLPVTTTSTSIVVK